MSVNLSELDKGVQYNGTNINILIEDVMTESYSIPSTISSIGYIPTDEQINAYDYIVTSTYTGTYTFYGLGGNPSLTLTQNREYKFLLIALSEHPFVITNNSGTTVGSNVDGVYTFTPAQFVTYEYKCTNHDTIMKGSISIESPQFSVFEVVLVSQTVDPDTNMATVTISVTQTVVDRDVIVDWALNAPDVSRQHRKTLQKDVTQDLTLSAIPSISIPQFQIDGTVTGDITNSLKWYEVEEDVGDEANGTGFYHALVGVNIVLDSSNLFQFEVLNRSTTSIVWLIRLTQEGKDVGSDWYISGKIKIAGSSTDDSVRQSADVQLIQTDLISTLTFENLSPDTDYELYDLQFTSTSISGILPNLQQRTSSAPTSHQPTFIEVSPPIRDDEIIIWRIQQTNNSYTEAITLSGIIGFLNYRFMNQGQNSVYDADTKIITLTFSGVFQGGTPWNLYHFMWNLPDSVDIPTRIEDLTFYDI